MEFISRLRRKELRMKHRKSLINLLVLTTLAGLCVSAMAQGSLDDYKRAEKFLPQNVEKLVYNLRVNPNWIDEDGSRFWYRIRIRQGEKFILVNPEKNSQKPAFDHTRLAVALSKATGKTVKPLELPFERIEYLDNGKAIKFKIEKDNWTCDLKTYECTKIGPDEPRNPSESKSPDGKWFVRYTSDPQPMIDAIERAVELGIKLGTGTSIPIPDVIEDKDTTCK